MGKVTCKLVKFMGVLSIAVSIITLVFITVFEMYVSFETQNWSLL